MASCERSYSGRAFSKRQTGRTMNDATANTMRVAPTTMFIRAMPRSASTTMSVPMLPAKPPPGSMSGLWTWKGRSPATRTQRTAQRHRASPAARTPCASLRGRLYMPDHAVQLDGKHKPDAYDDDASRSNVRLLRRPATIPPAPASTTALGRRSCEASGLARRLEMPPPIANPHRNMTASSSHLCR